MDIDLRLLNYFLAVAQEGNITRAANRLHISQPSLSRQLMELEQRVGKQLLVRGKRTTTLTEDGVFLRRRAEDILSLVEKTQRQLRSDMAEAAGEIAIGGHPTPSVLRAAAAVRREYPDIRFQFYSSDATDVMERLDHGSLDLAVFLEPVDPVKYDFISLPDVSRWGLLMPSDCPLCEKNCIQKTDLATVPLILHRRVGLQRLISHWAEAEPEGLNVAATYNVIHGCPEPFVKSGLGCCLITQDLLSPALDGAVCFRPLDPPLETRYALLWKRHAALSRAAEVFLQTCKEHLTDHA